MTKKLSYGFIKNQFEKSGNILLTTEYINNRQKLEYICSNGHEHSITWGHFKDGHGCLDCAGLSRPDIEYIKSSFEIEGCVFLTEKYVNNKQKLEYICPKGHRHSIRWADWCRGSRCPYCAGLAKLTIGFVRSDFEKKGYQLLSKEYVNAHTKLDYICPKGHKHSIIWANWQSGQRCPYCVGNVKYTIEFIRSKFEEEGYKLLTKEYKNRSQKFKYICPEGHRHSISWGHWQRGQRCFTCKSIKMSGPSHPNWKGGISCEPYCDIWLDKDFKESIKERDDYTCQNPDCWGTSKRLTVHHIDYNKKNCGPENLITLCRSCNVRANYNRKEWFEFYNNTMKENNVVDINVT